jgi:hypothetical protein
MMLGRQMASEDADLYKRKNTGPGTSSGDSE